MDARKDLYEVLGVSPHSEEVVVRAAYQALKAKYRGVGEPRDAWDERRAEEIDRAYAVLREPASRRAYDRQREGLGAEGAAAPRAPDTLPAASRARNGDSPHSTPPPPIRPATAWLLVVAVPLAVALALVGAWVARRPPRALAAAPSHGLTIRKRYAALGINPRQPLPCYVNGKPVGQLRVADCARRNGVATGPLDVGHDEPAPPGATAGRAFAQPLAAASPVRGAGQSPIASLHPGRASPPAPPPSMGGPAELVGSTPPAGGEAAPVVRAFYNALTAGDGERAAAFVTPEKRARGPLSASEMTRFYASLRQPLRVTEIYPLDAWTVFVRYWFVRRDGGRCRGAANVTTVRRGERIFVQGIRAYNGC